MPGNRKQRQLALLAKIETTYGTDAAPTEAANGMLMVDVTFSPLQATQNRRDLLLPYKGDQGVILSGYYSTIEASVELAGSGTAGTPPAFGPLLRCCGLSQVVTAGTKVEYQPVSDDEEAATIWYVRDKVKQVMVGVRGNVTLEPSPQGIPRLRFSLTGLHGAAASDLGSQPAPVLTGFKKPVPVNKAFTVFTLHGVTVGTERVSIDLGNQVEPRLIINEEEIVLPDRMTKGSAVLKAVSVATKDWVAIAKAHETGTMLLTHGNVAGNICEVSSPAAQVVTITEGATQKIMNNTLGLIMQPTAAGNDEVKFTFK